MWWFFRYGIMDLHLHVSSSGAQGQSTRTLWTEEETKYFFLQLIKGKILQPLSTIEKRQNAHSPSKWRLTGRDLTRITIQWKKPATTITFFRNDFGHTAFIWGETVMNVWQKSQRLETIVFMVCLKQEQRVIQFFNS